MVKGTPGLPRLPPNLLLQNSLSLEAGNSHQNPRKPQKPEHVCDRPRPGRRKAKESRKQWKRRETDRLPGGLAAERRLGPHQNWGREVG